MAVSTRPSKQRACKQTAALGYSFPQHCSDAAWLSLEGIFQKSFVYGLLGKVAESFRNIHREMTVIKREKWGNVKAKHKERRKRESLSSCILKDHSVEMHGGKAVICARMTLETSCRP